MSKKVQSLSKVEFLKWLEEQAKALRELISNYPRILHFEKAEAWQRIKAEIAERKP